MLLRAKIEHSLNVTFPFLQFCEFMSLCCLTHLAGRVVRILLDYVCHVPICLKLRLILEKQQEWPEICDIHGELCNYVRTCIQSLCTWLRYLSIKIFLDV